MSATKFARNIIRQCIELGISDFVLSPGSRNAPLSIALYEAEEAGLVDLHVRIDERGAAFFALGVSKASNNYVAVICTSGTAAANFHPAALEAYHSSNKLLVITADRPAHLRRTGSSQTTLQDGLLSPLETNDIASAISLEPLLGEGPVHLNIQFEEPLLSDEQGDWLAGIAPRTLPDLPRLSAQDFYPKSCGVLVVGHDRAGIAPEAISAYAAAIGWPLIAEDPLSFPESVPYAAILLSDPEVRSSFAPEQVIVVGRPTLSRSIAALIKESPEVIVIDPRALTVDTARAASLILEALPKAHPAHDAAWLGRWKSLSKIDAADLDFGWSEQKALALIAKGIPDGAALFVGSSRPVRDIEAFAAPRSGISTFANRGLAGIDGNIACAFGIAEKFERSYAILGDITFLHDISALVNATDENLTIFIIDNNGGGIFNTLPQANVTGFEKIFATPHNLELERVITGFGLPVVKVKSESDLQRAITHQSSGLSFVVVEVPSREENAAKLREISQSLINALRIGNNLA
jgi:2-succinyl-5-enolpyruvyl-6-hydroxy-3-cyclohexene-1-carboxylate synthase